MRDGKVRSVYGLPPRPCTTPSQRTTDGRRGQADSLARRGISYLRGTTNRNPSLGRIRKVEPGAVAPGSSDASVGPVCNRPAEEGRLQTGRLKKAGYKPAPR